MHVNRWEIVKKNEDYVKKSSEQYYRYEKTVTQDICEILPLDQHDAKQ